MTEIDPQNQKIKELINEVCVQVVRACNTVLMHADHFGFGLMDVPDPDATKLLALLNRRVIPILENLMVDTDIEPEDGVRLDSIREYLRLLKNVVEAIKDDNVDEFDASLTALRNQAFLVVD